MKNFGFCVLLFLLNSCSEPIPHDVFLVRSLRSEYISMMKKQEQMEVFGTGAAMMNEIESLFFAYNCAKTVNSTEARLITLRCINEFLNLINANEEIRPYLQTYPFPPSGLELIITFKPPAIVSSEDSHNYAAAVFVKKGILFYEKHDALSRYGVPWFDETYEEAILKVESERL